jgi:hypothetical protein
MNACLIMMKQYASSQQHNGTPHIETIFHFSAPSLNMDSVSYEHPSLFYSLHSRKIQQYSYSRMAGFCDHSGHFLSATPNNLSMG